MLWLGWSGSAVASPDRWRPFSGERVRQLERRALRRLGAEDGPTAANRVKVAKSMTAHVCSLSREALEAWTLLLLRGQPAHGYELSKRLGERGFHRLGPRIYRPLRELERSDVVRSEWAEGPSGPERRVYNSLKRALTSSRRARTFSRGAAKPYASAWSTTPGPFRRARPPHRVPNSTRRGLGVPRWYRRVQAQAVGALLGAQAKRLSTFAAGARGTRSGSRSPWQA